MTVAGSASTTRPQLTKVIVGELMNLITDEGLEAGDRLPTEAALIERFGVSRTVIREGLRELSALGIVSLQQGKPTTVRAPAAAPLQAYFKFAVNGRAAGLWEGFELRRSLEVEAAGLAAERAPSDLLNELERIVALMKETVHDTDRWVHDDLRFHVLIARGTGNKLTENLVEALSDVIQVGVRTLYEQAELLNVEQTYQRHARIFEAIRSRDEGAARAAMRDHFRAIEEKVFTMVERSGVSPN